MYKDIADSRKAVAFTACDTVSSDFCKGSGSTGGGNGGGGSTGGGNGGGGSTGGGNGGGGPTGGGSDGGGGPT